MTKKQMMEAIALLDDTIESQEEKIVELEDRIGAIVEFLKPVAIGSEQLWEMVCRDCLDMEVPAGIDLREEVEYL
jgi:hypothetical protein